MALARSEIPGQMSLFDWMPQVLPDPQPGEYVNRHGMVICAIMRPSYIGKIVIMDCSTESHAWYKAGILEKILRDKYFHCNTITKQYEETPCDRVIIYTGKKQRSSILMMPGANIYEPANAPTMEERVRMNRDRKAGNR